MNKALTVKTGQTHVQRYLDPLLERIEAGDVDPSFVVTHQELNRYESGRIFERVAETMNTDSGSEEVELSSGTYHLVVDHTNAGEASPQAAINQEAVDVRVTGTSEPLS